MIASFAVLKPKIRRVRIPPFWKLRVEFGRVAGKLIVGKLSEKCTKFVKSGWRRCARPAAKCLPPKMVCGRVFGTWISVQLWTRKKEKKRERKKPTPPSPPPQRNRRISERKKAKTREKKIKLCAADCVSAI